ncbi:uncharacterized protein MEPE_06516 [Melanopsichium pennsylvanicum]|uniref:Uncharacterized protein n=2 Tax=Melanopsichium pennsylvanicum TaxID=63383 RepID=A0AAJ4XSM4_9BASI|nr:uncharacterized protein BN887_05611 [Melanopsichium pennsylvanicum 4]SNX87805.1 uncharacterized protein MEPE_06516 [Melanopsichium pennsylvanicum]
MVSTLAVALVVLTSSALAQSGAAPYTTDNSQNACVEFGSCSTAQGASVITATQNAPVTPPAATPALATYTTLDSAYISSLAAAGASSAYNAQGGASGGSSAAALTVTSTVSRGATTAGASGSSGGASSTMSSLGGLSSSTNGGAGFEVKGMVVHAAVVALGAAIGAAVLL